MTSPQSDSRLREEKRQLLRRQLAIETESRIRSWHKLGNFLEDAYWTRDPKAKKIRKFPSRTQRPDLYLVADEILDQYPITNCHKSRQVMESNLHIAEPSRDVICWSNVVWIVRSLSEAHSKELVFDRIWYSLELLPKDVRLRYKIEATRSENRIDVVTRDGQPWNSTIFAAPDSIAWVRQRTPSGLLFDEFGSMPDAEEVYSVALPMVQAEDDAEGTKVVGKMRMLTTVVPDSEALKLAGKLYRQGRDEAIAAGQKAS